MVHESSWRPKHTLRATREAKFENLTFFHFHFLLRKQNYMMPELRKGSKSKIKRPEFELILKLMRTIVLHFYAI